MTNRDNNGIGNSNRNSNSKSSTNSRSKTKVLLIIIITIVRMYNSSKLRDRDARVCWLRTACGSSRMQCAHLEWIKRNCWTERPLSLCSSVL